jgi:nitrite reductase/ring-hydroxylating ferredoxin subunit
MARIFACLTDEMDKETSRTLAAGRAQIALFRNNAGEFYATADSCTHEQWSLGEDSDLEDNEVICPLHLARYDIRTGAALCIPATGPLATYPVEIDPDGKVYVIVDAGPEG